MGKIRRWKHGERRWKDGRRKVIQSSSKLDERGRGEIKRERHGEGEEDRVKVIRTGLKTR